jgi:hypothetical protein
MRVLVNGSMPPLTPEESLEQMAFYGCVFGVLLSTFVWDMCRLRRDARVPVSSPPVAPVPVVPVAVTPVDVAPEPAVPVSSQPEPSDEIAIRLIM